MIINRLGQIELFTAVALWVLLFPVFAPVCVSYEAETPGFTYEGFIEFENYFNVDPDKAFEDTIVKNELRLKLLARYGTETLYLFAAPDIYLSHSAAEYDYKDNSDETRTFRTSSSSFEIAFNELYVNYEAGVWQARAGNQVFGWGTADVFNPTSYFNPRDLREMIFRDQDEITTGIPAVSGMMFWGDYTVEAVFAPVHVPVTMSGKTGFWAFQSDNFQIPVVFSEEKALDVEPGNFGYGLRGSTTMGNVDMAVSVFHGPDNEQVFVPARTEVEPGNPMTLIVEPQYYVVSKFGMDLAVSIDQWVFQCEAAYSPDRRSPVEQDTSDVNAIELPYDVKETGAFAWSAGFNYFIPFYKMFNHHDGETIVTFEWYKVHYFDSEVMDPVISDVATLRFDGSYFDNRIKIALTGMMDTRYSGTMIWPEVGYNFQNGITAEVSYARIDGKSEVKNEPQSMFYYFRDNDILELKLRYDF